ncbi:conserved hypothetical protein, abortive infection family protein [Alteracholeplasma palmae J233]|uniref:CAAX prenyl protease 2/Lysostaphin resistance protein A-like domain-containing protein n=1 Tax=Alteracholeplasma palmae (strain ATCC 49389 / J233) TaxID=1318466 RepID=U4KKM1_ALTPJ|nr:type II CAAX endopeptidase family protein [Alteracholeplasma palmae]CCV64309.1 conserved hypothetical protein, abortive infection family protein [Alteracholeplasma palmae J233]
MYDKEIDFEEEFKTEVLDNFHDDEKNRVRYWIAIACYITLFSLQLLQIILLLIFRAFPGTTFFRTADYPNTLLDKQSTSVESLTILKESEFINASSELTILYKTVYKSDEYVFLIHRNAQGVITTDEAGYGVLDENNHIMLKEDTFNKILDGTITEWENKLKIKLAVSTIHVNDFKTNDTINLVEVGSGITMRPLANALILSLSYISMAGILFTVLKPQIVYDFDTLKKSKSASRIIPSSFASALLIILVFNILSNLIGTLIGNANQTSINQLSLNNLLSAQVPAVITLFSILVFGPFVEELIFRKSIFGLIKNERTALIVSTLVFALIHITTELLTGDFSNFFVSLISYSGGGVAFGYIYMKSNKNIWVSTAVHMIYNLLSVLLLFFA